MMAGLITRQAQDSGSRGSTSPTAALQSDPPAPPAGRIHAARTLTFAPDAIASPSLQPGPSLERAGVHALHRSV
jgi:hypothetical protein